MYPYNCRLFGYYAEQIIAELKLRGQAYISYDQYNVLGDRNDYITVMRIGRRAN